MAVRWSEIGVGVQRPVALLRDQCRRFGVRRLRSGNWCRWFSDTGNTAPMVIFDSLVIRTTTLTAGSNGSVARATIPTIGSSSLVIGPLALVVLMLSHRFWWFA